MDSEQTFAALVSEYLKHHSYLELSDYASCIPSTISRWVNGSSVPVAAMQKMITDHINKVRRSEGW